MIFAFMVHSHGHSHGPQPWWELPVEVGLLLVVFSIPVLALGLVRWLEKYYRKRRRRLKMNRKREEEAK